MRAFKTLFFAFALTGLFATSAQAYELDRIVAVVDQDVIVASEMDQEITLILAQIRERGTRLPPRAAI